MPRWVGAIFAWFVVLAAVPTWAQAQGVRIPFAANQYALSPDARTTLDQLRPEIARLGEITITGHADLGESAAAAEAVAMLRARTIGALLMGGDMAADLGPADRFFADESDVLDEAGGRRLDEAIARRRQAGGFLVFVHPRYGADALERRQADALANALYRRGATWIKADGDDFPPGAVEADAALRAEADAFRRTISQPAVVVQAFDTNLAEGPAALITLAMLRAEMVRDYLTAGGIPPGLINVRSAGADNPSRSAEENRWAEIVSAPSGW